ncbi:MAG: peptide ABC transporter permease [Candidatus Lindowbacteria bacterium RIFCSPLOWO2_12_FULL_62_27]|nr:MAG: peptide ABC transporter permease [Candidatus Lindowbacteria bacterium RIFCSPLOWO2_12_FULL_62_27]OGH63881.1 MAG: peptide ABC transporter permease [Candidatus Lindowbacteria bacterium RIFCSPLOWO2_02_FULL_62_12]
MTRGQGESLWADARRRLLQNRAAVLGLCVTGALLVAAALTPWISPYAYDEQDLNLGASPPTRAHLFGTDSLGRDLLTRMLYGSRISLVVGLLATLVSMIIGITYGAVSGYLGGRWDAVMMRLVDILYSLPFIFFVIILMVYFGRNIVNLFVALGCVQWLTTARIVRGQVLTLKQKEFVEAAVAMGVSTPGIVFRHLVPNVLGPIIVYATLTVPAVMLEEAFLSFLGLGVQPPNCSWGILIAEGVKHMELESWLILFPGFFLSLTLFSLNFLGDGLRDALDPKYRAD